MGLFERMKGIGPRPYMFRMIRRYRRSEGDSIFQGLSRESVFAGRQRRWPPSWI